VGVPGSRSGQNEGEGETREEKRENMLIKQKIFSRLEREELEYVASDLPRRRLQHNLY